MEFPEAGQHCSYPLCGRLDFLPLPCNGCGLVFCGEHALPLQHTCPSQNAKSEASVNEPLLLHTCTQDGCEAASSVRMDCNKCLRHFCLAHRHHGCHDVDREGERKKWEEPRRQFEEAKREADKQVEEGLRRALRSSARSQTANKVRLMRLKGRATGPASIPPLQRAHFLVHPPLSVRAPPAARAVFVSSAWSLGRATDCFADVLGVPNHNNEAGARKLRLFHRMDGHLLGEMNMTVKQLMEQGSVLDGDSLILEYECENLVLPDVDQYKE